MNIKAPEDTPQGLFILQQLWMEKLLVNPTANKGRAAALLPEITRQLRQLGVEFEVQHTADSRQTVEFARQAAIDNYTRVIAVGGDGTCHDVVNGLLMAAQEGHDATLGIIPIGSGNDLAYALGIPTDLTGACTILKKGTTRLIDVGRATVDGKCVYFANNVGLGLDAEVTLTARKIRILRGFLMYLGSAIRVIVLGRWPYQAKLVYNGKAYQQKITLLTAANGLRSGGGFFLTPDAVLDDGLLDICYASKLSRFEAFNLLYKTIKGTHRCHQAVTLSQSKKIEVFVEKGIPGQIDGEVLCLAGRNFVFDILPKALRVCA